MSISKKGRRKLIVREKIYWWYVKEDGRGEPFVHIIADDHSFIASCNLYCPVLRISKNGSRGSRDLPIPFDISERYLNFTPQYISELLVFVNEIS